MRISEKSGNCFRPQLTEKQKVQQAKACPYVERIKFQAKKTKIGVRIPDFVYISS